MIRKILILTASLFLLGCEKNSVHEKQEYVFGLQLSSFQLRFDYINLNTAEITNYSLPIKSGILYRGSFNGVNYYASVRDTIYEINITQNRIIRKFVSVDSILYLFNDIDNKLLIGLNIKNDTVGLYKILLATESQSFIKTDLISSSENLMTDATYNSNEETLIIKIGNELVTLDINTGERISAFAPQIMVLGLEYSKVENCLAFLSSSDNNLYYKKCDLNGNEIFSSVINADIAYFYGGNYILSDNNEYIFIAMSKDQKSKLYMIDSKGAITKKELISYDIIFGLSYIKK